MFVLETIPNNHHECSLRHQAQGPPSPSRLKEAAAHILLQVRKKPLYYLFLCSVFSSRSESAAMVRGNSNLSELPDTVPSLLNTIPGPNVGRGRPTGRPSITGRHGRRWSDPDDPARALGLTPSSSRDPVTGTPKRVSFDDESLHQSNAPGTNGAPLGDSTTDRRDASAGGLKRISSSLERIKQACGSSCTLLLFVKLLINDFH